MALAGLITRRRGPRTGPQGRAPKAKAKPLPQPVEVEAQVAQVQEFQVSVRPLVSMHAYRNVDLPWERPRGRASERPRVVQDSAVLSD